MTQHPGARRRSTRSGAIILTACLALLGGLLPASIAFTSEVEAGSSATGTDALTSSGLGTLTAVRPPTERGATLGARAPSTIVQQQEPATTDPVAVALESVSPTVARTGDPVKVSVTVTNTTDETLDGLEAKLAVNAVALTRRSALESWESLSLTDRVAASGPVARDVGKLAPGKSRKIELTFPTATYTLQGWGPREMSVELSTPSGRVGVLRTFLLYDGGVAPSGEDAMRLTIAAPVTTGTVDAADIAGARLLMAQEVADEGRLDQMLRVAESGKVSLAVDPNVVGLTQSTEDETVQDWGADFLAATERTSTYALPAWDTDLAPLAHADLTRRELRGFLDTPVIDEWTPPASWHDPLAWPAEGVGDRAVLDAANAADLSNVILSGGALAPLDPDVAEGRADVPVDDETSRVAVSDRTLSRTFTQGTDLLPALDGTASPETDGSDASGAAVPTRTGAAAAQRLLAETATIVARASSGRTHSLITVDRTWYPDPDSVQEILDVLDQASWVEIAPLGQLLDSKAPEIDRKPLPDKQVGQQELQPHAMMRLAGSRARITDFASIAADPEELSRNSLRALGAPLAVAYRSEADQRGAAVDNGVAYAQKIRDAVSVVPREGVNLISDRGHLPIRVRNQLDTDVEVMVILEPDSPRLTVADAVTETVPSGKGQDLEVPVEAIGSGDVTVTARLFTPSGVQVGSETTFEVRVRAGWEAIGTWIVAGLVGVLFLFGIWRTVRRGRSPNRATVEDVAAATGEVATTATSDAAETGRASSTGSDPTEDGPTTDPSRRTD